MVDENSEYKKRSLEFVLGFIASLFSFSCCCLILMLSMWLKMKSSSRLTIQRHRALTMGVMFMAIFLTYLSTFSIFFDISLPSTFVVVWFHQCHMIWTMIEGWCLFHALVKKEYLNSHLTNMWSWKPLVLIYTLPFLITAIPLVSDGYKHGLYWFFEKMNFVGVGADQLFWETSSGRMLSVFALIIPSTLIMLVFNVSIICLVIRSLAKRSRTLGSVSESRSSLPANPSRSLVLLSLSLLLGMNMVCCLLAFSAFEHLGFLARIFFLGTSGVLLLVQFIISSREVKDGLVAKLAFAQPKEKDQDMSLP